MLSTARIGIDTVIPAMQRGTLTGVNAISSRSGDRARAALDNGPVHSSLEDGLKNTRVIKAIFTAARENRWVKVER